MEPRRLLQATRQPGNAKESSPMIVPRPRGGASAARSMEQRRALHLRWIDRALLIWLYRRCPHILHAITIVKPETVVRWHRKGFAAYWRWKARSRGGRPRIAKEVRDGPVLSSAEAGVNLELLIVYGVACFAPSAHGVKDDFY